MAWVRVQQNLVVDSLCDAAPGRRLSQFGVKKKARSSLQRGSFASTMHTCTARLDQESGCVWPGFEASLFGLETVIPAENLGFEAGLQQSDVEVPAFAQAVETHQRRITQAILDHALKICSEKNVEVKTDVVVGDPKEKICSVTANLKADLLVMGCRAIGPLKRMFLGRVSNYCVNNVGCPVVVIKGT